jgi:hypothetical protein
LVGKVSLKIRNCFSLLYPLPFPCDHTVITPSGVIQNLYFAFVLLVATNDQFDLGMWNLVCRQVSKVTRNCVWNLFFYILTVTSTSAWNFEITMYETNITVRIGIKGSCVQELITELHNYYTFVWLISYIETFEGT